MGFTESVKTCLSQKYVVFQGRASRSEYWWFMLFYLIGLLALGALALALGLRSDFMRAGNFNFLALAPVIIFMLLMFLPTISVNVRRLHDRNMSGWWYLGFILISNIPYLGLVFALGWFVLMSLKGTEGPNRFGRDPLGSAYAADVFA